MKDILKTVEKTVLSHKLAEKGDKVLIALSGGSDSVYLLCAMLLLGRKIGFSVSAAHLNHRIRECADAEENFAKGLCENYGVEFFSKKTDVPRLAEELGISSETAGRKARYDFFEELRQSFGFTKIATAHHTDDNAETILMHFIRGSGANGLKGIGYIRDNLIIRPLLDISKSDITNECERLGLEYVTDKTNFEPIYARNKIRLELIPKITEYNPGFSATVTSNAKLFAEDEEFINAYTNKVFDENYNGGFPKKTLESLPKAVARRIFRRMYTEASKGGETLSQKYTDAALKLADGGKLSFLGGVTLYLSGGMYTAIKLPERFDFEINPGEEIRIPGKDEYIKIVPVREKGKDTFLVPENVEFRIRSRRTGDRFYPLGMTGSKTVSDLFTDKKIPPFERDYVPILTANGKIVCIGGKYKDRSFYAAEAGKPYKLEIKHGSDII